MLYAFILVCSASAQSCIGLEDQRGPYDTMPACRARIKELDAAVEGTLIPLLEMRGVPGPFRGIAACGTIEKLRGRFGADVLKGVQALEDKPA